MGYTFIAKKIKRRIFYIRIHVAYCIEAQWLEKEAFLLTKANYCLVKNRLATTSPA